MSAAARILVVDDDAQMRALLRLALSARGHEVVEAGSARQADAVVDKSAFDLVIVDGLLPDKPGARWIEAQRARGNKTPIVFATAFWKDLKTYRHLTDTLHVDWVVYKPIEPSTFVAHVERILAGVPAPPTTPASPVEDAPKASAVADTVQADSNSFDIAAAVAGFPLPRELEERLASVRRDYGRALPAKLDELAAAVHDASTTRDLGQSLMLAHRLRGTAGSYGFLEVSGAIAEVEEGLLLLESDPASSPAWRRVRHALIAAREVLPQWTPEPAALNRRDTILVVDSDPAALRAIGELLDDRLAEPLFASTHDQALEMARSRKIHAAILDMSLGDEAFPLAHALRRLDGNEALPIAFTSKDVSMEARVAAVGAGASSFLEKPIDRAVLEVTVRDLLIAGTSTKSRVLIVDDDDDAARLIEATLTADGAVVRRLSSPGDVMEVLSAFEPDLLLLDVQMPRITGYDVCRAVRAAARWRTLPILFLTATDAVPARVAAFRAGANDFLAKPCVQEELLARVRTHLSHARLLRERADVDSLSGLYLRAPFIAHAEARLSEARRNVGTMCVALLDLDHFKIVNDTRGHAVGDRVIRLFGRLLRERFRSEDLRGRWGGEEFVLAFPGQSAAAVGSIIRRCLAELAREPILDDNGDTFHQTFSAGVACFPHDGEGLHALLQRADRRLYLAKEQGRARVVIDDRQSS